MNTFINLIKKAFRHEKRDVKRFIRKHHEILTIPMGIALFYLFGLFAMKSKLLVWDWGIFQKLIFAVTAILCAIAFVYMLIALDNPYQRKLIDDSNKQFQELPILWQFLITYGKYFVLLVLLVLLVIFV